MAILGQLTLHGFGVIQVIQVKMHKAGCAAEFRRPVHLLCPGRQGATRRKRCALFFV